MVVRNTKLGGTDWPYGLSPVKAVDMNDTFNMIPKLLDVDTTATTWTTTDTTYKQLVSLSSGAITNNKILVQINCEFIALGEQTSAAATENGIPVIELQIGESGSEAQVKEWNPALTSYVVNSIAGGTVSVIITSPHTLMYVHTLTAGEKTNGFNVIVNGKYVIVGTISAITSTHLITTIMGIQ